MSLVFVPRLHEILRVQFLIDLQCCGLDFVLEYLFCSQVYDAINENPEAPNISFPDSGEEDRAIIDFHACKNLF